MVTSDKNNTNNNNNNQDKVADQLHKNEEARRNAPIVDGVAAIWKSPTSLWTEFEIVDAEGTPESESNVLKFGFQRGKISPDGRVMHLTLSDGDQRLVQLKPKEWDSLYESSIKDRLQLIILEKMRKSENNPRLSLKVAMRDPMFLAEYNGILQRSKSFLSRNLEPLRVNIEAGKVVTPGGGKPPKKHKRLTVGNDPHEGKEPSSEDDRPFLLRNYGSYNESIRIDKKLVKLAREPTSPAIVRRITERGTPVFMAGIVETSADEPIQRIYETKWRCRACGYEIHQHTWTYLEKPDGPSTCEVCEQQNAFEEDHVLFNSMLVKVQPDLVQTDSEEAASGRVWVLLRGNDQTRINPIGLKMMIYGHMHRMPLKNGGYDPVVIAHKARIR
jgi:hypothetical protein